MRNSSLIMDLYGVIFEPRYLVILTPYKNMETLKTYLKNFKVPREMVYRIMLKICTSILECHSKNISHRDIKLENILIDNNLNISIIDFGYSIRIEKVSDMEKVRYCGTPLYMAPELIVKDPYNRNIFLFYIESQG